MTNADHQGGKAPRAVAATLGRGAAVLPIFVLAAMIEGNAPSTVAWAGLALEEGRTIVSTRGAWGTDIAIYINGKQITKKPTQDWADISHLVRPGINGVRAVNNAEQEAGLAVTLAVGPGRQETLTAFTVPAQRKAPEGASRTFTLPVSGGGEEQRAGSRS